MRMAKGFAAARNIDINMVQDIPFLGGDLDTLLLLTVPAISDPHFHHTLQWISDFQGM